MRRSVTAASAAAALLAAALWTARPAAAGPFDPVKDPPQVTVTPDYVCWESLPKSWESLPKNLAAKPPRQSCEVPIKLSEPSLDKVAVHFRTKPGTARPKLDYVEVLDGLVVIPPGETAGFAAVRVLDDQVKEPDETLAVELVRADGAIITKPVGVVTIRSSS